MSAMLSDFSALQSALERALSIETSSKMAIEKGTIPKTPRSTRNSFDRSNDHDS